jgi:hypothetical protein
MAVGDSHTAGPDGWALCGASGPLRGYTATSPQCRDCFVMEGSAQWKTAPTYVPIPDSHTTTHALQRKRPTRLLP